MRDYETITCSHCECEYLHQYKVEVQVRDDEDGDGNTVIVNGGSGLGGWDCPPFSVEQKRLKSKDINHRRDNIYIYLKCEECENDTVMLFEQHKGSTLLYKS
jgi:hypothetical protein